MNHGGDLISYESYYDGNLIDFSSNINPLGPPKGLEKVLIDSFNLLEEYPDIQYRKLKKSISEYLDCEEDNVLVGNGAVEIINNFTILAKRVLLLTPSFSEYEERAIVHGKSVERIPYKDDFTIDVELIERVIQKDDLLILGNPNNPTGLRIEKDILIETYKIVKKVGAYLLLDEAFFEFCPKDYDSTQLFKNEDYENVAIIRAATKFFSLPGIRLGYCCASSEKVKEIQKIELPWSINSLADAAGQFIFNDEEYIRESQVYIAEERKFLLEELSKINYLKVYNTHTNYILLKLLKWDEEYIFKELLQNGIVIRKCKSFIGLSDGYIRVAIKDREKNIKLIKALNIL